MAALPSPTPVATPVPTATLAPVVVIAQGNDVATWVTALATILLAVVAGVSLWTNRDLIRATIQQAGATSKLVDLTVASVALQKPNMEIHLVGGMCVHAREATTFAPVGTTSFVFTSQTTPAAQVVWVRCQPTEEGATLFVQMDLQVRNQSTIDDGVTGAEMTLHKDDSGTVIGLAERRLGQPFHGENVKANSLTALRLQFSFEKMNYQQFAEWTYQPQTKYDVEISTMRGPSVHLQIEPAAHTPLGNEGDLVIV